MDKGGVNMAFFRRHNHTLSTTTSIARDHVHNIKTWTFPARAIPGGHVHRIRALTTFNREHLHSFIRTTGPAINVGRGMHIHYVKGLTNIVLEHRHCVRAFTSTAPNPPNE